MVDISRIAKQLGVSLRGVQFLTNPDKDIRGIDLGFSKTEDVMGHFSRRVQKEIETVWMRRSAENPNMFDGPMASLTEFWINQRDELCLETRSTSWKVYDSRRDRAPRKMIDMYPLDKRFSFPISIGCITITSDDKIIFGVRSKGAAFGRGLSVALPAGGFNPERHKFQAGDPGKEVTVYSLRSTIDQELFEEVGLRDYYSLEWMGMIYDGILAKQPLVAARVCLHFSSLEIDSRDMGDEVLSYYFVDNTIATVRDFFSYYPPTPHDIGKTVLHFRRG